MYDCFIFNQSSRNEILAIIDGLVQSFFSKYLITSDVADEALNLLSQTTQHLDALKAEIAWNSNFEVLVKRDYIRDEMRKSPSTRYHRLIIKNRKISANASILNTTLIRARFTIIFAIFLRRRVFISALLIQCHWGIWLCILMI